MGKKFFTVNAELPSAYEVAKKLGVDKDGDVQDFVTDEVMRNLPDFMPRDSGTLIGSMYKPRRNLVRVSTPYARFLFFGLTKSGNPVDYSKQKNPNGGPHWDRRLAAARGEAIADNVKRYIKGRGKR